MNISKMQNINIMKYTFIITLIILSFPLHAQPKIKFSYDAAGNRVKRELVPMLTGGNNEERNLSTGETVTLSTDQIRVWPNPAEYYLNIEVISSDEEGTEKPDQQQMTGELFDLNGRLVQRAELHTNPAVMQMEGLPAGTYFLYVRKGGKYLKWTVQKI